MYCRITYSPPSLFVLIRILNNSGISEAHSQTPSSLFQKLGRSSFVSFFLAQNCAYQIFLLAFRTDRPLGDVASFTICTANVASISFLAFYYAYAVILHKRRHTRLLLARWKAFLDRSTVDRFHLYLMQQYLILPLDAVWESFQHLLVHFWLEHQANFHIKGSFFSQWLFRHSMKTCIAPTPPFPVSDVFTLSCTLLINVIFFFRSKFFTQWLIFLFLFRPQWHGCSLFRRQQDGIIFVEELWSLHTFNCMSSDDQSERRVIHNQELRAWVTPPSIIGTMTTSPETVVSDPSAILRFQFELCWWKCNWIQWLAVVTLGTAPVSNITCTVDPNTDTLTNFNYL